MTEPSNDYSSIGMLVAKAQELLDRIKGGAIRTMQTEFDALKQLFTDKLNGADSELLAFINQQKANVNSIFADPDKRYQRVDPVTLTINGDKDKFYPVVFGSTDVDRLVRIYIGRRVHADVGSSGAMYAAFRAVSYAWGTRPSTMVMETLKTSTHSVDPNVVADGFLGNYSASAPHPNGVVVWLRGGYTYSFWIDGAPLNRVVETTDKTASAIKDAAQVYLNGYENTAAGSYQKLDVLAARDATKVPNFISYEEA